MRLVLFFCLLLFNATAQEEMVLQWQFFHPIKKIWIPAGAFGSVQEKLIEIGELPDPFVVTNENAFDWIENYNWEYICNLEVKSYQLNKKFNHIEFPCVDTYARIYVNDSLIGFTENTFIPYRFNVNNFLKVGKNTIKAVFIPPILYHKENYSKASYHLPAPNDINKELAVAPYTRKPQYQFGWDWTMRMNTIGFLKPARFIVSDYPEIIGTYSTTDAITENQAELTLTLQLSNPLSQKMTWKSKLFGDFEMIPGQTNYIEHVQVSKPRLWWPRGQGSQNLYKDEWQLVDVSGRVIDVREVRFGIRQTALITEPDKWGTSYYIKVNNRPIFCKGADYIPQSIFPSKITENALRKMVETMFETNFNMVRVWGGGYYPDEAFFDACDELGIMVWQDFMFACAMYPGDSAFLNNVQKELNYQIPRMASHPCLTLFNGNNEVEVAWKNWGFQVQYKLFGKASSEIEQSYDALFKQLIPTSINHFTNTPYIHTSPLSNWGKDEFYNHGSQHYWGVWHGKDPLDDFGRKIGRFNAEYGFQSFPEYATLLSFSTKSEWDLNSSVMKQRQKSYVGNGMILKHAKILYGTPSDFEEFVYFSQLTQATAVSMAVCGHRLDAPRCMGTLYWQLNDCWPAPTWSSMDYYWHWKALNYSIKKDYEDVAILRKRDMNSTDEFFLISDLIDTFECQIQCVIFNLEGHKINQFRLNEQLKGNQTRKITMPKSVMKYSDSNYVLQFEWNNAQKRLFNRTYSKINKPYNKAAASDLKFEIVEVDPIQKIAKLRFQNSKYIRNCWFTSEIMGIHFDENVEDYLPGTYEINFKYEQLPSIEDISVHWM